MPSGAAKVVDLGSKVGLPPLSINLKVPVRTDISVAFCLGTYWICSTSWRSKFAKVSKLGVTDLCNDVGTREARYFNWADTGS